MPSGRERSARRGNGRGGSRRVAIGIVALGAVLIAAAAGCASRKPAMPLGIEELGPPYLERRVEVTGRVSGLEYALDGFGTVAFQLEGSGSAVRCLEEGWNAIVLSDLATRLAGAQDRGTPVTVQGVYASGADDRGRVTERIEIDTVRVGDTTIDTDSKDSYGGPRRGWVY